MPASPLLSQSSKKAAALIIVLAFVVLVTGLTLAYFTRTTTDRQMGQSNYNNTSADLLARSALDIVVGDFQQEIANGSTPVYVSGTKIYVPTSAANVVPQRNNPTPIPNLIRISVNGDPGITAPAVGSRASAVNSTNDPSANGRSISTTRWNKHCLIPVGDSSTATIDNPSPTPSFTPPDWVIVTRAGPAPFASWDATLADPTSSNYAVGRYAYAVYDEGGLLDMNTVGYPFPAATPIPELVQDIGRKGVPAWTDLTAIVPTPTPTPFLSGAYSMVPWINKLVGFRNYATTLQSNVSNLDFPGSNGAPVPNTAVASFMNYLMGGFYDANISSSGQRMVPAIGFGPAGRDLGAVNSVSTQSGSSFRTDQAFTTRAELIRFFSSTNILAPATSVGILQYMGTFSREQNKPTLPLTPAWPYTRVVLPQRFYLGNLNLAAYPSPTPTPFFTPTPTPTPTPTGTPPLDAIQSNFGLQFQSLTTPPPATPTPTPTPGPCDLQVRWKYVGNQDPLNTTPLSAIPAFPSDLTNMDFFQYINYALFGVTGDDFTHIPYTLGIGAALIDQYDADGNHFSSSNANALITGIYYGSGTSPCDLPTVCLVYGVEYEISGSPSRLVPWYVSPTCMGAMPTPDSSPTLGSGPFSINSSTRNVGEFGWAYSILNAANSRNTSPPPSISDRS